MKNKKGESEVLEWIGGVIIFLAISFGIGWLIGAWGESETGNSAENQMLIDNFNDYHEEFGDGIIEGNHILDKLSLQTISNTERISVMNEYVRQYEKQIDLANRFIDFINRNQANLKNIGYDIDDEYDYISRTLDVGKRNIEGFNRDIKNMQLSGSSGISDEDLTELLKIIGMVLI